MHLSELFLSRKGNKKASAESPTRQLAGYAQLVKLL